MNTNPAQRDYFRLLLEDIDPHVCSMDQLQDLIGEASTQWDQGYLCGIQSVRRQMEILTGRSC